MTITERLIRKAIAKWMPDHHLHYNPGKHPLGRMERNGAVSANLDKFEMQVEDYQQWRENSGKV